MNAGVKLTNSQKMNVAIEENLKSDDPKRNKHLKRSNRRCYIKARRKRENARSLKRKDGRLKKPLDILTTQLN